MCGIGGIVGEVQNCHEILKIMNHAMIHRGPDAAGYYVDESIGLTHRRLSIIDLSESANQPQFDINNRFVIVFNGEIYNYQEVKSQITDYAWRTNSDTEVILAAYIKWGKDFLNKLNGMFALAIWDKAKKELFITRDRLGVKPFYYYYKDNTFIFASEIRSILSTGLINKELDLTGITEFLGFQAVKTPNTLIKGIKQLPPSTFGILNEKGFTIYPYWNIVKESNSNFTLNYQDTLFKVKSTFTEAVKSRMVADVPVSAFLSGGIDSSAIVAVMSQLSSKPIETYSIVFKDKAFDESEYSQLIAKKYNTLHTELLLQPHQLLDELSGFFNSMDSPTLDGINTYMVSKLVANTGTRVTLSGLGGDELFSGYQGFKQYKQFNHFNNSIVKALAPLCIPLLPSTRAGGKLAQLFKSPDWNLSSFYANNRAIFLPNEIEALGLNPNARVPWIDLSSAMVTKYPILSQYSVAELTNYTLDVLLKDTDQMSMASSLEVREPFFDYRLIEFILQVPDNFKYKNKTPKSLLVNALGDLIPSEVVYRPKKGFSFPWDNWLRNELRDYCNNALMRLEDSRIFKEGTLATLWQRFISKDPQIRWMHIWSLVVLERWLSVNKLV